MYLSENSDLERGQLPHAPYYTILKRDKKCQCYCIRRPNWYINNVGGLYAGLTDKEIPLKSSHLDARVFNSTSTIKYSQIYTNSETAPLEVLYRFPIDAYFGVTGVHIKLGDKEIDATIMAKEEAKHKYDDAIAAGNTAAKINYDENIPEVLELAVGALQPGKSVKITVEMVAKCDITKHGFYSFVFPLNFIPRYSKPGSGKGPKGRGAYIPGKFSASILVESSSKISDLMTSHKGMAQKITNSGKTVSLELAQSGAVKAADIVVSFATETIRKPQITLHASTKHPDEVVAHITCIPRISEDTHAQSVEDTNEEVKELEDPTGAAEALTKVDNKDDPEIASGEYIFLLDRSGSMKNKGRLILAKDALKLFLKSLPADSKFNIIGFGSFLRVMHKDGSVQYTKDSLEKALVEIASMTPNLKGTQLLEPLKYVFRTPDDPKYPRNVFILTDGAIKDTDPVMKIVKENNHSARVHSFGFGSGASKYLVNEISRAGLGTSEMIEDNDKKLKAKIISTLSQASKPALTDIQMDWGYNEHAVNFQVPRKPMLGFVYEEEILDCYAVLSKDTLIEGELTLSFLNTLDQQRLDFTLNVDPEAIIDDGEDDSVFKLAAKENITHLNRLKTHATAAEDETVGGADVSELCLYYSLKYSVLSQETAFFGKIKNKDKSGEEIKKIEIPIRKMINTQKPSSKTRRLSSMLKKSCKLPALQNRGEPHSIIEESWMTKQAILVPRSLKKKSCTNSMKPASSYKFKKSSNSNISYGFFKKCSNENDFEEGKSTKSDIVKIKTKAYEKVIEYQELDGHFIQLPEKYQNLLDNDIPEELENLLKDSSKMIEVWITILSILILENFYSSSKDEWIMIAKKAKSYLKKNLVAGADITPFTKYLS
ncbi:unnamed protein product [Moneuplotes crassus]|uniref:Uncharacterized protein n=1 Tax=Euplotes crassus TaxID=5936 RepID=A0AAD2D6J3_EUPCR|nr:unnamed protein product [Moneuplotes crassus]